MSSIEYINSQVISSGVTSVTFSNIPSNYADLILSANVVGSANAYPFLVINGSGGSISRLWLSGNGSSASSNKLSDSYIVGRGNKVAPIVISCWCAVAVIATGAITIASKIQQRNLLEDDDDPSLDGDIEVAM